MTLLPPTRKRNRSCEEEDFLPLSKKINNLHINNWRSVNSSQEQGIKWNNPSSDPCLNVYPQGLTNGRQEDESRNSTSPFKSTQESLQNGFSEIEINENYKHLNNELYKNNGFSETKYTNGESSNQNERVQNDWPTVYNPDLSVDENPYYYESNKLLFELYVERLQRGGY